MTLRRSMFTAIALPILAGLPVFAQDGVPVFEKYRDLTDRATERGLKFLAQVQAPNGSFPGFGGNTAGVVGLAGMAFLAKGYTPEHHEFGTNVNLCVDYIVRIQENNGYLGGSDGKMYSHGIGTLFLSEVSGMVDSERQKRVDAALPEAVKLILAAQQVQKDDRQKGGWRYAPNSNDSDMSVTGWVLMALRSARLNGAAVPDKAIDDAVDYIRRHRDEQTGSFGYQDSRNFAVTLTGAGLLCLELAGRHGTPESYKAGAYILQSLGELPKQERPYYGNYYNAQGMFQLGAEYWDRYATWMYEYWLPRQNDDGSWNPHNEGRQNRGNLGGQSVYKTSLMLLALSVPYRQLPIYQRDETVDEEP